MQLTNDPPRPQFPSPWRTIWLSPRSTGRRLLETDNWREWLPVIVFAAPASFLSVVQSARLNPALANVPPAEFVWTWAKFEFYTLVLSPFVLAAIGRLLKGTASARRIRPIVMWAHLPVAVASAFWIPVVLSAGTAVLHEARGGWTVELARFASQSAGLWSSVVLIIMLAEAEAFSVGRAIVAYIGQWCGVVLYVTAVNALLRGVGLV
jgi:hypothetical protein